jgi:hypothetical protein
VSALALTQSHTQREQLGLAEKNAKRAREADAGNAEYLALHSWLRARQAELADSRHA